MGKLRIDTLDPSSQVLVEACTTLIVNAFADPVRYSAERVRLELGSDDPVFYRRFFIATHESEVVAIGGVKAADWATKTHLLYLSAVAPDLRGQGIARALLAARVEWLSKRFGTGRVLVSTSRTKRFRELGFVEIRGSTLDGRSLMRYHLRKKRKSAA